MNIFLNYLLLEEGLRSLIFLYKTYISFYLTKDRSRVA